MEYLTEPSKASHKKQNFSCGELLLDNYLHRQAKQDVKKFLSICFTLADPDNKVLGYYTLSNLAIRKNLMPGALAKKIPPSYDDLPVTFLGRLAVDQTETGKGIGGKLLLDALKRSYDTSSTIGSMAVIVNPLDKEAENFYAAYNFILLQDSGKMFLPMKLLRNYSIFYSGWRSIKDELKSKKIVLFSSPRLFILYLSPLMEL